MIENVPRSGSPSGVSPVAGSTPTGPTLPDAAEADLRLHRVARVEPERSYRPGCCSRTGGGENMFLSPPDSTGQQGARHRAVPCPSGIDRRGKLGRARWTYITVVGSSARRTGAAADGSCSRSPRGVARTLGLVHPHERRPLVARTTERSQCRPPQPLRLEPGDLTPTVLLESVCCGFVPSAHFVPDSACVSLVGSSRQLRLGWRPPSTGEVGHQLSCSRLVLFDR